MFRKNQLLILHVTSALLVLVLTLTFSPIYAQVTNPSMGDTIAHYCANGICHTPGGPVTTINRNSPQIQPVKNNDTIGTIKLSQSCIGNNCNNVTHIQQLGRIGIQLSQVCLRDTIYNLTTTCLNYKDLKSLDNTNPIFAGIWVDKPYEHRLAPKIKNHENFNQNPWAIMVDPNADFTTNAKMIIVDTHFTWTNQNDSSDRGLSMKSYEDRYVSSDCNEARIGPNIALIQDTITYLESGCITTKMNTTKIISQKEIPSSYDNPYSSLHYQNQIKKVKSIGGLGLCLQNQCNIKDPYKKIGY